MEMVVIAFALMCIAFGAGYFLAEHLAGRPVLHFKHTVVHQSQVQGLIFVGGRDANS